MFCYKLVDDIIYKDIVAFHGLKNPRLLKDYFALLMERVGKQVSMNKMANILGISADTASRYLQMFVNTYLVYLVPRYGKTNEVILSPKKIYSADLGIRNIFTGFRDKGSLFENIVFNMLKTLDPKYVYQNGIKIDFITNNRILVEVKYNREINHKQQELFTQFVADKKIIIRNFNELKKIKNITQTDFVD